MILSICIVSPRLCHRVCGFRRLHKVPCPARSESTFLSPLRQRPGGACRPATICPSLKSSSRVSPLDLTICPVALHVQPSPAPRPPPSLPLRGQVAALTCHLPGGALARRPRGSTALSFGTALSLGTSLSLGSREARAHGPCAHRPCAHRLCAHGHTIHVHEPAAPSPVCAPLSLSHHSAPMLLMGSLACTTCACTCVHVPCTCCTTRVRPRAGDYHRLRLPDLSSPTAVATPVKSRTKLDFTGLDGLDWTFATAPLHTTPTTQPVPRRQLSGAGRGEPLSGDRGGSCR